MMKSIENIESDERTENDIHLAAFGMKHFGLPLKPSREMLDKMNKESLFDFHKKIFRPNRMALTAVGVRSDVFSTSAEQFFGSFSPVDDDNLFADDDEMKFEKKIKIH